MNNSTVNVDEQIISLRKEGLMQKEIMKELSVTRDKVRYVLKKANMENFEYEKKCENCNMVYKTTAHHSKFCGESCRGIFNKKNRGHEQICALCKKGFINYKKQSFCSSECLHENNLRHKLIRHFAIVVYKITQRTNCKYCNKEFITNNGRCYCSSECSYKHWYDNIKANRETHNKKCIECGRHYSTTREKSNYCSESCRKKYNYRRRDTRRRARLKKNGRIDWDISVERLIERDKNKCHICGDEIDKTKHTNHDLYPSIDHVVPVSRGGTHTWDNVKLAHRICNTLKSNSNLF